MGGGGGVGGGGVGGRGGGFPLYETLLGVFLQGQYNSIHRTYSDRCFKLSYGKVSPSAYLASITRADGNSCILTIRPRGNHTAQSDGKG